MRKTTSILDKLVAFNNISSINKSKYRVTVLMPAYNVGPWIHEAIESVLAQTFKDFTLLVIDDIAEPKWCETGVKVLYCTGVGDETLTMSRKKSFGNS